MINILFRYHSVNHAATFFPGTKFETTINDVSFDEASALQRNIEAKIEQVKIDTRADILRVITRTISP